MCFTTGTDSAIASTPLSEPSILANGVRTPAANQMFAAWRDGLFMAKPLQRSCNTVEENFEIDCLSIISRQIISA
jgi:hypothetical protein